MAVNELGRKRDPATGVDNPAVPFCCVVLPSRQRWGFPRQHLHNNEHRRAVLDRLTTKQENKK